MVKNLFAVAAFAAMLPMGVAHGQPVVQSQEGIALENQILQLQQQVQQLEPGGGGGSALGGASAPAPALAAPSQSTPDSSVVTNLLNQVGQLQSQVQQLNGEIDTLQNQVNTQHDATEKEIGDLNFKVTGGAAPGAPGAPAPAGGPQSLTNTMQAPPAPQAQEAPAPASAAAPQVAAPSSPRAALRDAQAAYAQHDYATAASLSHSVLSKAAGSPEAYKAQYLLAQSLSAQGKAQDAAIAYDNAYNLDRTGADAPQSLLGLASSLTEIHQNEAACDTLSSLNSQFPTPPAGMQSRIDAASHRAHCS
jgi:TolA-binding protein